MVVNENAYYKGKIWCAYDLKDATGQYTEEYRLHMRKESQRKMFTCPDCGEKLILCTGSIKEPFFKHYSDTKCISRISTGSGRYLPVRRMLYQLARRSFPEAQIDFNVKLSSKYITDIFVTQENSKMVIE